MNLSHHLFYFQHSVIFQTDQKLLNLFNESYGEKRGNFDYGFTVQFKRREETSLMVSMKGKCMNKLSL